MFNIRLLVFTYLILLTQLVFMGQALALNVNDIRFGVHSDKARLVLDLSKVVKFRVFVLSDPYRLVLDLPSFQWNAGAISRPAGTNITAVRHGNLQPGISRIVFDLNSPIFISSVFTLSKQIGKPNRLVIDYTKISTSHFKQVQQKTYGTLNENNLSKQHSQAAYAVPQPITPTTKMKEKPLIVIDPGHGGIDPGAIGINKILEKDVVLALGKELKKQLKATGQYRVRLTRNTDRFIKLRNRVKFARDLNADLFISLHADSIRKKNVRGASFYTLSEKASDKQTARLAANENKSDIIAGVDLSMEDKEVASILVDLTMRDTTNQAKFCANKLLNSFISKNVHILDNAHRHAGFAVLKAPDIPSVLVEAGFMSNRKEAKMLNTSSYHKKISSALVKGINEYFAQIRKNQRI